MKPQNSSYFDISTISLDSLAQALVFQLNLISRAATFEMQLKCAQYCEVRHFQAFISS